MVTAVDAHQGPSPVSGQAVQAALREALGLLAEAQRCTADAVRRLGVVDECGLAKLWGYTSTERLIAHTVGVANRDGSDLLRVARHLARHPATGKALADGEITLGQAGVLARAAAGFDDAYGQWEARWLEACRGRDVDELERTVRQWRAQIDLERTAADAEHTLHTRGLWAQQGFDGSCTGRFRLDPVGAEIMFTALETQPDPVSTLTEPRTLAQRRADKLVDVCRQSLTGPHDDLNGNVVDPGHKPGGETILGRHDDSAVDVTDRDDGSNDEMTPGPDNDTISEMTPGTDDASGGDVSGAGMAGADKGNSSPCTTCGGEPSGQGGAGVSVDVIIDVETLAGHDPSDLERLRSELAYGGPIAGPGLDRLLCDASFRALVTDGPRTVLAYTRATPDIAPGLRRAIRRRDRHCQFTGCDRPWNWCDVHHIIPRNLRGPTNHDNLVLLCRFHHTCIHEGRWQLTRAPNGDVTVTSP